MTDPTPKKYDGPPMDCPAVRRYREEDDAAMRERLALEERADLVAAAMKLKAKRDYDRKEAEAWKRCVDAWKASVPTDPAP